MTRSNCEGCDDTGWQGGESQVGVTEPCPDCNTPPCSDSTQRSDRRFRKKPVVIEAHCFAQWEPLMSWLVALGLEDEDGDGSDGSPGMWMAEDDKALIIDTLEGEMRAEPGDWIIRGVKGEFYPVKPDIFEATYEGVLDA